MECQPHKSPTDYRLTIVSGPDGGKMYPLAAETRVGRDPQADVFVGDSVVARWQCVLVWEEEAFRHFLDRGWFRPVFVNGKRVSENQRVPLQAGDRIAIADTTFVYEHNQDMTPADLEAILTDETVTSPLDVFRRCQALEQLCAAGTDAQGSLPLIFSSLLVPVSVDCDLALRVAAAEAVWKVGRRHDLALPLLAWALRDQYWGVSRKAAELLSEMGPDAQDAIPDLLSLARRRLDSGPFHYESSRSDNRSLLAVIVTALGDCGPGHGHYYEICQVLTRIVDCQDRDARAAAKRVLDQIQDMSTEPSDAPKRRWFGFLKW